MDSATPFLKKYYNFQLQYESKYGKNTIVFIEKGKFYECYETDFPSKIGKAKVVGNVLGITIAKVNSDKDNGINNPSLVGVPVYALDRHLPKLIDKYTIVIASQVKNSDKKIDHVVTQILSPGTCINEIKANNYICYISIDEQKSILLNKIVRYETIIFLDLSIGKPLIYDFRNSNTKEDEYSRLLSIYNPSEVISKNNLKDISCIFHKRDMDPVYYKPEYQLTFLSKIFKTTQNVIEYLGLDKYSHIIPSLISILQFVYEHDQNIIKNLDIPTIMNDNNNLSINSGLIYQLNLISNNNLDMYTDSRSKYNSLFSVIDNTKTKMGYRMLYDRMLFPLNNIVELNRRYSLIEKIDDNKYREILSNIIDIEKKHRKMFIGKLHPFEFYNLIQSYSHISKLLEIATKDIYPDKIGIYTEFKKYTKELKELFDTSIMKEYSLSNIEKSFFHKGIDEKLDKLDSGILNVNRFFEKVAEKFSLLINENKFDLVKVQYSEKEGYFLTCTKTRWDILKAKLKNETVTVNKKDLIDLVTINSKSAVKITSDLLQEKSDKLIEKYSELHDYIKNLYLDKLAMLSSKYKNCFIDITNLISEIDVVCSSKYTSKKYGYTKPIIKECKESFVEVKNIRHPIIERININNQYIGNDISLKNNGMLIYGINASGKSSLLKSLGCCLILSHMGMYVPCDYMVFSPFNNIMTKLTTTDNLFKNQSTFVCEMIELKDMIDRSSCNSIILCDELCSSTETLSGISLMAAAIKEFTNKKSNFMLTPHLHSVLEISDIKKLVDKKDLSIYNFSVSVNTEGDIIYNRKLIPGSGDSLYGLEIAKGLKFPSHFISDSFKYRKEIETGNVYSESLVPTKTSRYNSNLFIDSCFKCGSIKNLHTHHIHEQNTSDSNGLIKEINNNKNVKYNLMILCQECHKKVHSKEK